MWGHEAVSLCRWMLKRDGAVPGRKRGRCGTPPAGMGRAVQRRCEGKAFPWLKIISPAWLTRDIAGMVAAMTEGDPGVEIERASHNILG